ncbi:hypothetical protein PERMA_A0032 (plasmid) [Persephonella marina EX-H1]|uniref:Uncharacterized protein n=1 Tax=Persephonella marina (strain DSM 14350 / EX-H1) TaxID=123214 RepID=C0QUW1_PERMH|nr:conjugal transfer protein TraH [Persephonella marina]ACO04983.1 hypothetical protein PERMA_A0032 [Persephonella marina EX-H1]
MKKLIASLAFASLLIAPTKADINATLDKIVGSSYYLPPGEIKSPTTNTYTLGSYSFRLRNDLLNRPVLSLRPPQATFSCSGADFDAGMLSMLNLNTFGDMLSQAGTSVAWGIMIGLVYSLPGIGDAFQKLNEWARMFQQLISNSCMIGTQIGKNLGSSIWESGRTNAQGKGVASGSVSSFEAAQKEFIDLIKTTGEIKKFFGTIPYGPLYEGGWTDTETADLVASLFGVLEWRAVDTAGNDCTDTSCLKNAKIKVVYYPPLTNNLQDIINGATMQIYHCNWGYDTNIGTFKCNGGVEVSNKDIPEGLRQKIVNRIDGIVDDIIDGTFMANPDDAQWIKSVPLPNFPEVINYLAILKKQGFTSQYNSALYGVSELISSMMLKVLIDNAYASLSSIGRYFTNKDMPKDLAGAQQNITKVKAQIDDYIQKNIQSNYITIQVASQTYRSIKSAVEKGFVDKFGQTAYLFMR